MDAHHGNGFAKAFLQEDGMAEVRGLTHAECMAESGVLYATVQHHHDEEEVRCLMGGEALGQSAD